VVGLPEKVAALETRRLSPDEQRAQASPSSAAGAPTPSRASSAAMTSTKETPCAPGVAALLQPAAEPYTTAQMSYDLRYRGRDPGPLRTVTFDLDVRSR